MKNHVFITPGGRVLGHWLSAFPEAHCTSAKGLQTGWLTSGTVIWACGIRTSSLAKLLQKFPDLHLVCLSMKPNAEDGLRAIEIGAKGYCHALSAARMLKEVALVVNHGGLWLGPDLMQHAVKAVANIPRTEKPQSNPWDALTQRECAVAHCITAGAANKEIAEKLGITQRTVKAHLAAMFEKLGVRDRLQLALRLGDPSQAPEPIGASHSDTPIQHPVPKDNRQSV